MNMHDLILALAPRSAMAARLADVSQPRCYYFGWTAAGGHRLHACKLSQRALWAAEVEMQRALGGLTRCGNPLDATPCWNGARSYGQRDETEGRAFVTCRGGWTAVAFWDRSGDQRGASNTVFLARGELTFAQLVRASKHTWPQVWARFTFEVVQVDGLGQEVRS